MILISDNFDYIVLDRKKPIYQNSLTFAHDREISNWAKVHKVRV